MAFMEMTLYTILDLRPTALNELSKDFNEAIRCRIKKQQYVAAVHKKIHLIRASVDEPKMTIS